MGVWQSDLQSDKKFPKLIVERQRGAISHLKINLTVTPGADFKGFTSIFKNTLLTVFKIADPHPQNLKLLPVHPHTML